MKSNGLVHRFDVDDIRWTEVDSIRTTLSNRFLNDNMYCIFRRFSSIRKLANPRKKPFEQEINQFLGDGRKISEQEWGKLRANLLQNAKNQSHLDNIILKHFAGLPSMCQDLAYTKQYLQALHALNVQPSLNNYEQLVRSYCRKSDEQQLTREEQTELLETWVGLLARIQMW